jgi:uncharacterized protein YceH (UPF0502 family)
VTRWQRFLWRLGFTGYAHVDNALELLEQRDLEMARSLLRSAGRQRDHAHLLLRAAREVCSMPEALERSINCATADESERDIDQHEIETAAFLDREGIRW